MNPAGTPVGAPISATDDSHYIGTASPAIDIEKATNGADSDVAPGETIAVGNTVTWTYVVTNLGDVPLSNVTVADDDPAVVVDCGNGSAVVAGPIGPGATFTCQATGTAVAGQYTNNSTVVGTPTDGAGNPLGLGDVAANDPSNYFGGNPGLQIQKATNNLDADSPSGPALITGSTVTWTYVVENNGNQPLTNVTVTDSDPSVVVFCPTGTGNVIGNLAAGGFAECTANGTAIDGAYSNVGTVTGDDPGMNPVSDTDPSNYFGANPAIDIEKDTNGVQSDAMPGATIAVGDAVTWTYVVTNTGTTTLTSVVVTDDQSNVTVDCSGAIPALAPGDTATCTAMGVATAGQYANIGSVTGVPSDAAGTPLVGADGMLLAPVTDTDPSHYFGGELGLTLEKATNTVDADVDPGPVVAVGETITWTYTVGNAGNVALTDVTVTDDLVAAADIDCGAGSNVIANLASGDTVVCTAIGTAVAGQYANVGTASVDDPNKPGHPARCNRPVPLLRSCTCSHDCEGHQRR